MTSPGADRPPFQTFDLLGMSLACTDSSQLIDHIFSSLAQGRGGWLITANLDFLRRHTRDPEARTLYAAANIRVADGMPLVWAAWLQGDRIPERVAGSALLLPIVERAALECRSIYFLGGEPSANSKAVSLLRERWPSLKVSGHSSPMLANPPSEDQVTALRDELSDAQPDLLLVGMGSPKQELLIRDLRPNLPHTWMIGVGISFSFVAGDVRRAPSWMQRSGVEWLWRLAQEPRRLARRYVIEDLPFAFVLFGSALWRRVRPSR